MLAQEKKRTARVVGDTPIYDIVIGTDEGDVRLGKLNRYLIKLPANLSKDQVATLEKRLAALGGSRAAAVPPGPLPHSGRSVLGRPPRSGRPAPGFRPRSGRPVSGLPP